MFDFELPKKKCCSQADCTSKYVQMNHGCEFCGEPCLQCEFFPFQHKPNCLPDYTVCRICGRNLPEKYDLYICESCMSLKDFKLESQDHRFTQTLTGEIISSQEKKRSKKLQRNVINNDSNTTPGQLDQQPAEKKITIINNGNSSLIRVRTIDQLLETEFTSMINNQPAAFVPSSFWALWNKHKEEIKEFGFYMKKINDKFYLFRNTEKKEKKANTLF